MYLSHAELFGVAPFGHIAFPFRGADAEPRMVTVVHGTGGVGKTALLQILSQHAGRGGACACRVRVGARRR
jgi:hypothetical protein